MQSNLLNGDVPTSSRSYDNNNGYSSHSSGSSSSSGVAAYFSDESKTITRRTFSCLLLTLAITLIIAFSLILALAFKKNDTNVDYVYINNSTIIYINNGTTPTNGTTPITPPNPTILAENIQSTDLMVHLNALEGIAEANGNTRVITMSGFNATVEYIWSQLQTTAYKLQRQYFPVERWIVDTTVTSLTSYDSDGANSSYIYATDFIAITNSGIQGPNVENSTVAYVANGGCNQADWDGYNSTIRSVVGQIALVERFDAICNFSRQAQWAINYGAIGLIVYNTENNRNLLTNLVVTQYTPIPVFLTTYQVGNGFWQAAQAGANYYITMNLQLANNGTTIVTNIIADTTYGDATSTVVVGSHMDGVQAGPGVNDNGSGSSANLAMALQMDRMVKAGVWGAGVTPPNRIRWMWFGAEEQGLLGSRYHVQQASLSTVVGERAADYAVMLNYDMLGSPNFYYGVYNASSAPVNTPTRALAGSRIISQLHYDYFQSHQLPYDGTAFDGRSDYGQFLAVGVVAGGLFSGAEQLKTIEQRRRYDDMLGAGMGGQANAAYDSCYHRSCDDVRNIHRGAHLNMTRAAASVVQTLVMQQTLRTYLQYPA